MRPRPTPLSPAQPGWFVCLLVKAGKDDEGKEYPAWLCPHPIVAWEIIRTEGPYDRCANRPGERWVAREVIPIAPDLPSLEGVGNEWVIKQPDGRFSIPGDASWGDEADVIRALSAPPMAG